MVCGGVVEGIVELVVMLGFVRLARVMDFLI